MICLEVYAAKAGLVRQFSICQRRFKMGRTNGTLARHFKSLLVSGH